MNKPVLPKAGDRVGAVCGPCQFPQDNSGIVLAVIESKWGDYALVLMDSGETETCHGLTSVGIGWYLIGKAVEA